MKVKPYFDTVMANRLPYRLDNEDLNTGGVVSACISVMTRGSKWYGIDDGSAPHGYTGKEMLPGNRGEQVRLRPSKEDADGHYHAISNGVLWAAHHRMPEKIEAYSDEARVQYDNVNRMAADAVINRHRIMVHDYQLSLVPKMIRGGERKRWLAPLLDKKAIMYYQHIPMWDVETQEKVKELPDHEGIERLMIDELEGMLYSDLVGFQTPLDAHMFAVLVNRNIPSTRIRENADDSYSIEYKDHIARAEAFPISIDTDVVRDYVTGTQINFRFEDGTDLQEKLQEAKRKGHSVAAKIGRLDYTKAFEENMLIAEKLSQMGLPIEYFVIAAPTRESLNAYKEARDRTIKLAEDINRRNYERLGYNLIFFRNESIPFGESTLCLMRDCDIYLDASKIDGKHLTPEEATEAKAVLPYKERGIIVIGANTGTGWQHSAGGFGPEDGLVIINPEDIEKSAVGIMHTIRGGYNVSDILIDFRRNHNVTKWIYDIEESMEKARKTNAKSILTIAGRHSFQ